MEKPRDLCVFPFLSSISGVQDAILHCAITISSYLETNRAIDCCYYESCFDIYGVFGVLWCLCRGLTMVAPVKFSWFEATLNVHSVLQVPNHFTGSSLLRRYTTVLMIYDCFNFTV
ncbi:hypothetical protein DEO72_LG11g1895 [Vigna unguiculata]|uniref:Uncharacterized protein n=1 Tax=Vigna unguiculata TaxID=3917 RepID=A0A4D6NQV8_VIGUN|nr:hypothetical protein DEO72_LG11g1895 [Vigna unguiculata]